MPSHEQLKEIFLRNNLRFRDQAELQSMAKAAREFYELGRAQALEDAAKVCEQIASTHGAAKYLGSSECVAAIRALAEQAGKGG